MNTQLVYVLTCAPEATYVEQALMAIWSARYWNPDAHIILITDDKTSELLHQDSQRGTVLQYISEEKVVPFPEDKPMHYRSRWLKTSVRELVAGDLLFIDCDTICQKPIDSIDQCPYDVAMVPDEHMRVSEYHPDLKAQLSRNAHKLGYDALAEEWHFNSGVIFAKDTKVVHELWNKWHECWLEGEIQGVGIDQAALGKADLLCGHIIHRLDDVWNTLIYMNPIFAHDGKILHFWSFRNKSFMFGKSFLLHVRESGLTDYVKDCILHPMKSVLPFDNILSRASLADWFRYWKTIREQKKLYARNVDKTFSNFPWNNVANLYKRFYTIRILKKQVKNKVYFS